MFYMAVKFTVLHSRYRQREKVRDVHGRVYL